MNYFRDAFKALEDVSDDIIKDYTLKSSKKKVSESLEKDKKELKEGYLGQTLSHFLDMFTAEPQNVAVYNIAEDMSDEPAYETSNADIPDHILEAEFHDFDLGGSPLTINVSKDAYQNEWYQTISDLVEDFNGDEVIIYDVDENKELFNGYKEDIPDELLDRSFNSVDASDFMAVNVEFESEKDFDDEYYDGYRDDYDEQEETDELLDVDEKLEKEEKVEEKAECKEDCNLDEAVVTKLPIIKELQQEELFKDMTDSELANIIRIYVKDQQENFDRKGFYPEHVTKDELVSFIEDIGGWAGFVFDFSTFDLQPIMDVYLRVIPKDPVLLDSVKEFADKYHLMDAVENDYPIEKTDANYIRTVFEDSDVLGDTVSEIEQIYKSKSNSENKEEEKEPVMEEKETVVEDKPVENDPLDEPLIKEDLEECPECEEPLEDDCVVKIIVLEPITQEEHDELCANDPCMEDDLKIIPTGEVNQEQWEGFLKEAKCKSWSTWDKLYESYQKELEEKKKESSKTGNLIDRIKAIKLSEGNITEEHKDLSMDVNLNDSKEVEEGQEFIDNDEEDKPIEQVVDVDAEAIEDLKPSYLGNIILQCPACKTMIYKDIEDVKKDENEVEEGAPVFFNVGEECPHCGSTDGFILIGQVAKLDTEEQEEVEDEEEQPVEDNIDIEVKDDELDNDIVEEDLDTDAMKRAAEQLNISVSELEEKLSEEEKKELKRIVKKLK